MARIFIIEDDLVIQTELKRLLEHNGYQVEIAQDFTRCVQEALASKSDLVVLDLNLPEKDGLQICKEIRQASSMVIMVVTSRDTEIDEVMAIRTGADDFVAKPYSAHILLARIEALLRRVEPDHSSEILTCGDIDLDLRAFEVSYKGQSISLSKNEFRILQALMRNPKACISRQDLMYELWCSDEFIDDNTLTVNVNRLRASLGKIGIDKVIKTHRGQGYSIQP